MRNFLSVEAVRNDGRRVSDGQLTLIDDLSFVQMKQRTVVDNLIESGAISAEQLNTGAAEDSIEILRTAELQARQ